MLMVFLLSIVALLPGWARVDAYRFIDRVSIVKEIDGNEVLGRTYADGRIEIKESLVQKPYLFATILRHEIEHDLGKGECDAYSIQLKVAHELNDKESIAMARNYWWTLSTCFKPYDDSILETQP